VTGGRRAHASTMSLSKAVPSISSIPFMRALAEEEKWLRAKRQRKCCPSSTGQIKMPGASARWATILPMLQMKAGL